MKTNKHFNTSRINSGMALEKIIALIEKYIGLDIIIMLLGLLHSADGMRGYPFPWLSPMQSDPLKFLMSLVIVTLLVVVSDILTRIYIKVTEPVTKDRLSIERFSSYSDPYTDSNTIEPSFSVNKSPTLSGTVKTIAEKAAKTGKYEESIRDDYKKVKEMLNGKAPTLNTSRSTSRNRRNTSSGGGVLAIILTIMFVLTIGVSMFADDFFGTEENWGEPYYAEDEDGSTLESICEGCLFDLGDREVSWFEDIAGDDADDFLDMTEWQTAGYELVFTGYETGTDPQTAVLRYRLDTIGDSYLAAFKFESDDIYEDTDPELVGFAVCKYPETDDEIVSDFGWNHADENDYSEDQIAEYTNQIEDSIITTGDCTMDEQSILIW